MKAYKYFLFLILFSCTSCVIKMNGNLQGLYSYYEKTKKENPDLFGNSEQICNLRYNQHIYVTNGIKIKECIKNDNKSLIYIWGPHCKSKVCIPLNTIQEICSKKGVKLYIVAEYYDSELMSKKYNLDFPIFGIDTHYYKATLVEKYVKKFMNDLNVNTELGERYLYFEKGNFVKSYEDIYTKDVL